MLTQSLHPDALPKLATLELGTGHAQDTRKTIDKSMHLITLESFLDKSHTTHNPVLVAVN